jgi:hypothetical protein
MIKVCPKCNVEHTMNGKFCSKKCGNSRTWTKEQNESRSKKVALHHEEHGHPQLGVSGWKHTDEQKEIKRQRSIEYYDKVGRKEYTDQELKAKRVEGVQAYRSRKYDATPHDADRKLIRMIYESCPTGYEVDHVIAISEGGKHHEDNLQYLPAMENRRKNRTQNYDRSLVVRWQDVVKV